MSTSVLQPTQALLAIVLGLTAAAVLFIPFVIISYRARGRMGAWWVLGWAASAVYAAALICYTLLPLPASTDYVCRGVQLQPAHDLIAAVRQASGLRDLARSMAVWQVALNVVLFLPLGFLLRVRHRRGWFAATGIGLTVSAIIETTQLTGVWGLYPCAYRVFDVDDLAANTLGALIGSLVALAFVAPASRTRSSAPRPVTRWRRFVGMVCDGMLVVLVPAVTSLAVQMALAVIAPDALEGCGRVVFVFVVWGLPLIVQLGWVLVTGGTFGDWAVLLRTRRAGRLPAWLGRPVRFLTGSGALGALSLLDAAQMIWGDLSAGWAARAAWTLVVASLVGLWAVPGARGLSGWLSGTTVVDRRQGDADSVAVADGAPTTLNT